MKTTCNDGCIQSLCADGCITSLQGTLGEFTRLAQRRHSKAMVAARTPRHFNCCSGLCRVAARQNWREAANPQDFAPAQRAWRGVSPLVIKSRRTKGRGPMKSLGSRGRRSRVS